MLAQAAVSRARVHLAALSRDQRGVAAVEFALFAPILIGGLLSMVDIGLAVTERMNLDHVLRAGVHAAMAGREEQAILKVLETTASEHFSLAGSTPETSTGNPVTLRVTCMCSGENGTEECTACAGSNRAHVYYRLSAEKLYNGVFLKELRLQTSIEVQLR
ncbi:TadE/TadG family type IV pilus assembly protein [Microvirga makkahensis]|uniref:TadE-like domain-containing protein n=1 Tax=Microvirga makkahensis TaxID=1128670 RepID=A0A7X3MP79_9HYPH|nr:TadE/TadG family type IV pilus assembly protein [Microvirga makkahensis]MXQ10689.1 hypothetical protein [Microvirga makkahensis]